MNNYTSPPRDPVSTNIITFVVLMIWTGLGFLYLSQTAEEILDSQKETQQKIESLEEEVEKKVEPQIFIIPPWGRA